MGITAIIALEDKDGLSRCGKRLSKDRVMLSDIKREFSHIFASEYTAALFPEPGYVSPIPPVLPDDAVLFLEIVYRWNRRYPSDRKYTPADNGWELVSTEDFAGYSHPKITKERYRKK